MESRSSSKGKQIFSQAGCSKCHVVEGQGKKFGPDLSNVINRHRDAKLLQQILTPSAEIHKDFQTHMFLTDSGRVISGLIVKETPSEIHVLPNPLDPEKTVVVDRETIDERKLSKASTMPQGLLDTFQRDEILDLLTYLQHVGQQGSGK